jgi:hypothetical protein
MAASALPLVSWPTSDDSVVSINFAFLPSMPLAFNNCMTISARCTLFAADNDAPVLEIS